MGGARRSFKNDSQAQPVFSPSQLSAVTAWLRNTATSGSVASVTDVLNVNPATQSTAANQPTATTLNALPALSFDGTNDWLAWPVIAGNAGAVTWGLAHWIKLATVGGLRTILGGEAVGTGMSGDRIWFTANGTDLLVDIFTSNGVSRRGTASGILSTAAPHFLSLEYDGGQATEAAKCTIWLDNVKQTLTFSNSSGVPPGSTMPATLVVPTGSYAIGIENISTNLRPLSATFGSNIYALGGTGGISGGGLLTSASRLALMNFEPAA
jgi:hypothetical protein